MKITAFANGLLFLMLLSVDVARAQEASQPPAWFKQADKNGDGKLSREEAPNKDVFGDVDTDGDGFASLAEVNAWLAKQPKPGIVMDRSAIQRPQDQRGFAERTTTDERTATNAVSDDVEKRPVVIFSDGTRMAGDLYLPKNRKPDEKFPAIVLCAGTSGTKGARRLASRRSLPATVSWCWPSTIAAGARAKAN